MSGPPFSLQENFTTVERGATHFVDSSDNRDFALARYLPDGSLDASFGVGGQVTTDFGGQPDGDGAVALVLQPYGKLVAAGFSERGGDFALARYLPDGGLDAGFDGGGMVTMDFGGADDLAFGLARQPDGKMVAAGNPEGRRATSRWPATCPTAAWMPASAGGALATMDFGGHPTSPMAWPCSPMARSWRLDQPGPGGGDFALARYLPDGSLDATFGVGGKVTTDFGGSDGAIALVLQPDGKLVAAGLHVMELIRLCPGALRSPHWW